jgi:hypothetical protein
MWNDFEKDKHILENRHTRFLEGKPACEIEAEVFKMHDEHPYSAENRGKIIK